MLVSYSLCRRPGSWERTVDSASQILRFPVTDWHGNSWIFPRKVDNNIGNDEDTIIRLIPRLMIR